MPSVAGPAVGVGGLPSTGRGDVGNRPVGMEATETLRPEHKAHESGLNSRTRQLGARPARSWVPEGPGFPGLPWSRRAGQGSGGQRGLSPCSHPVLPPPPPPHIWPAISAHTWTHVTPQVWPPALLAFGLPAPQQPACLARAPPPTPQCLRVDPSLPRQSPGPHRSPSVPIGSAACLPRAGEAQALGQAWSSPGAPVPTQAHHRAGVPPHPPPDEVPGAAAIGGTPSERTALFGGDHRLSEPHMVLQSREAPAQRAVRPQLGGRVWTPTHWTRLVEGPDLR